MPNEASIGLRIIIHVDGKMIVNQDDDVTIDIANKDGYSVPVINGQPYDLSSYLMVQVNTDDISDDIPDVAEELMMIGMWIGALGLSVREHIQIHCLPFVESEDAEEALALFTDGDDGCGGEGYMCDDCLRNLMDEPEFD